MENHSSRRSAHECLTCRKTFSQKSSLVRHLKLCTRTVKPASLRQKSCQHCAAAKAKCDLKRPCCSRCTLREIPCIYASSPDSDSGHSESLSHPTNHTSSTGVSVQPSGSNADNVMDVLCNDLLNRNFPIEGLGSGDTSLDLIPFENSVYDGTFSTTSDFPALGEPWMLSSLSQTMTPPLVQHSMETLLRALRTWPRILCKGFQLPPMFHHSISRSTVPLPLANCCTLVKMWDSQFSGTNALVQGTILTEIKTLFHNFKSYDEADSLAALQAMTIYAIMLVFPAKDQQSIPFLDSEVFSEIQQVVRHTALSGMILEEETENCVPSWEAWIHVTSKRRAIFTLYLLHWAYSVYHHAPSFDCHELAYIPAPAPKYLWNATSEEQWKGLYERWLAQWQGQQYLQHEFMFITPGPFLDVRTQLWLEDTDEFGMLFMSIFNATDREAYGFLPRCFTISPGETTESSNSSVHS